MYHVQQLQSARSIIFLLAEFSRRTRWNYPMIISNGQAALAPRSPPMKNTSDFTLFSTMKHISEFSRDWLLLFLILFLSKKRHISGGLKLSFEEYLLEKFVLFIVQDKLKNTSHSCVCFKAPWYFVKSMTALDGLLTNITCFAKFLVPVLTV